MRSNGKVPVSIFSKVSPRPEECQSKERKRKHLFLRPKLESKMEFGTLLKGGVEMVEKDLRRLLRQKWNGWLDWLEPRGNAGVGRPDVDLLVDGAIVPVELKIGSVVDLSDRQFRVKIRPDQVAWQHRFYAAGGISLFLIADGPTEMWLCRKLIMSFPGDKWVFDDCWVVDVKDLSNSLRTAISEAK